MSRRRRFKKMMRIFTLLFVLLLYEGISSAAVPSKVNVQGVLRNVAGQVVYGSYTLTFNLYNQPDGAVPIWTYTTPSPVTVIGGVFSVDLAIPDTHFKNNSNLYLEIQVGSDPPLPRKELMSAGYATKAGASDECTVSFDVSCVGCVEPGDVSFTYAGSSTKGGAADSALSLNCTGCITGTHIQDGSVGTADLANLAVTTAKIADNAVTSAKLATDSVTTSKIVNLNVTEGKIADGAVTTNKIADLAVTEAKIASNAVTAGKVAQNTIGTLHIVDGAVTSAKISDGTITSADLNDTVKFVSVRNDAGIEQFAVTDGSPGLQFQGGNNVSITFTPASQRVSISAAGSVSQINQGAGIVLSPNPIVGTGTVSVDFAGSGAANTVARSDHTHSNNATIGGPYVLLSPGSPQTGFINLGGGTNTSTIAGTLNVGVNLSVTGQTSTGTLSTGQVTGSAGASFAGNINTNSNLQTGGTTRIDSAGNVTGAAGSFTSMTVSGNTSTGTLSTGQITGSAGASFTGNVSMAQLTASDGIFSGAVTVGDASGVDRLSFGTNGILRLGTYTPVSPLSGDFRYSGGSLTYYDGSAWQTLVHTGTTNLLNYLRKNQADTSSVSVATGGGYLYSFTQTNTTTATGAREILLLTDNVAAPGANDFFIRGVQGGGTKFSITSGGNLSASGSGSFSGNVNANNLQTGGTTRISATGDLQNIVNATLSGNLIVGDNVADYIKVSGGANLITRTNAGPPTDSPSDGALVVDTSQNSLWIRSNGAWYNPTDVGALDDNFVRTTGNVPQTINGTKTFLTAPLLNTNASSDLTLTENIFSTNSASADRLEINNTGSGSLSLRLVDGGLLVGGPVGSPNAQITNAGAISGTSAAFTGAVTVTGRLSFPSGGVIQLGPAPSSPMNGDIIYSGGSIQYWDAGSWKTLAQTASGAGYVELGRTTAQTDNTAAGSSSIFFNRLNTGNLLKLQYGAVDRFVVDQNGNLTAQGNLSGVNLSGSGNLSVNGNVTLGNATSDLITFNARAGSTLNPSANNSYNLGASSLRWQNVFAGVLDANNLLLNPQGALPTPTTGRVYYDSGSNRLKYYSTGWKTVATTDDISGTDLFIKKGPSVIQVDSSTYPTVYINKTGAAPFMEFWVGGSKRFEVTNGANLISTGYLSGADLRVSGTTVVNSSRAATFTGITDTGSLDVRGNVLLGDAGSDSISFNGSVNTNINPSSDLAYKLGSSSRAWLDVYTKNLWLRPYDTSAITGSNGLLVFDSTVSKLKVWAGGWKTIQTQDVADAGYVKLQASTPGSAQSGHLNITGTAIAGSFSGNGASLTNLNASNLASGTVPSARISGSYTGITGVGTLTAGTWNASPIGPTYGGTGLSSFSAGSLLYASAANTWGALTGPSGAGQFLRSSGANTFAWSGIQLSDMPSGVVKGSGTTSYVPKWTAGDTIGNSQIYDSGSSVLIGTTANPPAPNKLQIVGGGAYNLGSVCGNSYCFHFNNNGWIYTGNTSNAVYGGVGVAAHNFWANSDIYLGARGIWLSSWLNQNLTTGASPTFAQVYTNGWFRNNNCNTGLYNQNTGKHFYSKCGGNYWVMNSNHGLQFRAGYEGTVTGYLYWSGTPGSNNFGLLSPSGQWRVRVDNSNVETYGGLYTSTAYIPFMYDRDNTAYYIDPASISMTNDFRANIFYDRQDTFYYMDPQTWSRMWGLGTYYLRNNYNVTADHPFGLYFANNLSSAYAIFREGGVWSFPYPDLRIAFHTGIKIGANGSYKGVNFYTDYDMSSLVLSVNNDDYDYGASASITAHQGCFMQPNSQSYANNMIARGHCDCVWAYRRPVIQPGGDWTSAGCAGAGPGMFMVYLRSDDWMICCRPCNFIGGNI